MMNADPFGSANPFGGATAQPAAPQAADTHIDPQADEQDDSPVHQAKLVFDDDDPFGVLSAPPPAPARAPSAPAPSDSDNVFADPYAAVASAPPAEAAGAAAVAASAPPYAVPAGVPAVVPHVTPAGAPPASAAVAAAPEPPLSPTERIVRGLKGWQDSANRLFAGSFHASLVDKKAFALENAAKKGLRVNPSLSAGATTEDGLQQLCTSLRLSPFGYPFSLCSRIEISSATKSPGVGMELPFWMYTFTLYTIIQDYANQPRYDGQDVKSYGQVGNIWSVEFKRRYRDFEWLRKMLVLENPHVVVPPIPEKSFQGLREKFGGDDNEGFEGRDLGDSAQGKTEWQEDKEVSSCNKCKVKFGFTVRKHHCRRCLLIFCNNCCPKMQGGKRFCTECNTLTGLTEMLMKNPEVAFRMKGFQLFLAECFNGPLSHSKVLRFFIEAPYTMFNEQKALWQKRIEAAHPAPESIGDSAGRFFSGLFASKESEETPPAMTADHSQRAVQLTKMRDAIFLLRNQLSAQLFEGLARKRTPPPDLPGKFKGDADMKALWRATADVDSALAEFTTHTKELLFEIIAHTTCMGGMMTSMVRLIADADRMNKVKQKSEALQTFLHAIIDDIDKEDKHLQKYIAANFKKVMHMMWRIERHRDTTDYDWSGLQKVVESLQDPKF